MARIEPIPYDELTLGSRAVIEDGLAAGRYTNPLPLQIVAYSSTALKAMDAQYRETFQRGVLEPRLVELLRMHSARVNECAPCSASQKDDSITADEVACLIELDAALFTPREYRALRFSELFSREPEAIDDDTFRWLAEVFSPAEIVELGYVCSQNLAGHRLMHVLGVLQDTDVVCPYVPGAVDAAHAAASAPASPTTNVRGRSASRP